MSAGAGPRVLMIGTVNSPHLQHLAAALAGELSEVVLAGWASDAFPQRPSSGPRTLQMPARARGRFGTPFQIAWMARLLRRLRPDVVHVHGVSELAANAARAGAAPLVLTAYGSDLLVAPRARAVAVLARAAAVTADSPWLAERAVALGADPERTQRLGWGVDLQRFVPGDRAAARRALRLPADGRLVLSPRALADVYNPSLVVAAFDLVADADPEARLVVKHLGAAADVPASRHPSRVHVIGDLPYERMPDVYTAADVCVSVPESDSAPRTVWEAMACATPCVLSELPWLEGMVEREKDALAVPLEPAALADAIRRVLGDPRLAGDLGRRGRELVEREHDARQQRAGWLDLYRRVASAASTAPR